MTEITLGAKNAQQTQTDYTKSKAEQAGLPQEFIKNDFVTPTDEIELPSKGKFYPNGQSSIKIKYLTTEEDDILTSPDLIKNGKVLDVLLEHAIIDKTLRPDDLLICDKNAVLIGLSSKCINDDYSFKMM